MTNTASPRPRRVDCSSVSVSASFWRAMPAIVGSINRASPASARAAAGRGRNALFELREQIRLVDADLVRTDRMNPRTKTSAGRPSESPASR